MSDIRPAVVAFLRGFAVGYGVKATVEIGRHAIGTIALIVRQSKARSQKLLIERIIAALWSRRNAQFGLFLGTALFLYRAMLVVIRKIFRLRRDQLHPAQVFAAGGVAALAIAIDSGRDAMSRRRTLTLYAAAKSIQYLVQVLVHKEKLPRIPSLPGWLFTAACGQIMFAWFYHPETLPPSYDRWISLMANMDQGLRRALRDVHFHRVAYGTAPSLNSNISSYIQRHGFDSSNVSVME